MAKAPAPKKKIKPAAPKPKGAAKPVLPAKKRAPSPARDPETGLTPKQAAFVREYLVDLNATQAAIRAGYSPRTANEQAARLLVNVSVAAAIEKAMAERSQRTEITQDMVLQRWWDIATADPNEVIQFRRTCCRYCHGKAFEYQWIDEQEYAQAVTSAQLAHSQSKGKKSAPLVIPKNDGGYGFVHSADPHPDCPKCMGEGRADVFAHDTRRLTGAARLLYAGTKLTQSGFEIKTLDQGKALENVARHLGMFKETPADRDKDGMEKLDEVGRAARLAAIFASIERRRAANGGDA